MALLLGYTGGLLRACQGAYKDSPYEPFIFLKFVRSLLFGTLGGLFWYYIDQKFYLSISPVIFLPLVVFFDSIMTEMYKRGIRVEDLSKYKMPTIFHLNGTLIHNRLERILIIYIVISFLLLIYAAMWSFVAIVPILQYNAVLRGLAGGFVGGALVATGGSLLDSAWEGFDILKFGRSIGVGMFWGVVLSFYTANPGLLVYAVLGTDRMSLEFFKTFIKKLKSGKFKSDKPTIPHWLENREKLIYPYIITWAIFIFLLAVY